MGRTINKRGVTRTEAIIAIIIGVLVFFFVIYFFWGLKAKAHDIMCAGVCFLKKSVVEWVKGWPVGPLSGPLGDLADWIQGALLTAPFGCSC